MKASELQSLWARLKEAGLVAGWPPPADAATAPWFVRVMLGVAGWIGAVFLLSFVGLGLHFVVESAGVAMAFGIGACACAYWLFRIQPDSDFLTQFGLALSLAGQGLVLFALGKWLRNQESTVALAMALLQAVLFILSSNFVHRVWVAWTGACAVVFALAVWHLEAYGPGLLAAACAWVWASEFRYAQRGTMLRPGGYGLVLALICAIGLVVWHSGAWDWRPGGWRAPSRDYHLWLGAGLGGAALPWVVWRLLVRESVNPISITGSLLLAAAGILALVALKAPGLAPTTMVLLLGFGNGNRVLAGLGIAALLSYLSCYYYSLEVTLLYKSALMAGTGGSLLAVRFLLRQWWPAPVQPEAPHA